MDNKEFKEYVIECKRIGLENSQIARKLGMDPRRKKAVGRNAETGCSESDKRNTCKAYGRIH